MVLNISQFFVFHKGCCAKIKVDSTGIGRTQHYWAMGTFVKDEKLTEASLGTKTVYKQNKIPENTQQYYLEGSENDGWKVILSKTYVVVLFS